MPYPGQGEPVPPEVAAGDWIIDGLVVLSCDPDTDRVGTVRPIRLPARDIARAMNITTDEVFRANREKRLVLTNTAVPPRGAGRAMRFRVTIGGLWWEGTMEIEDL